MNTSDIIREIDAELERLHQARSLLGGASGKKKPGRPKGSVSKPGKRVLSASARKKIAMAQKKRWAAVHKAARAKARIRTESRNERHRRIMKEVKEKEKQAASLKS